MSSDQKRFVAQSTISVVGSLFAGISNYIFHFIISRRLSIAEYGELQTLLALVSVLGIVAVTFSNYTIKEVSGLKAEAEGKNLGSFAVKLKSYTYAATSWLILLLALAAYFLVKALHLHGYTGILLVYVTVGAGILASVYTGILSGFQDFKQTTWVSGFSAMLKLVLGVVIAWVYPSASFVVISLALASIVSLLLARRFASKKIPEVTEKTPANFKIEKSFLKTLAPVFVFSLLLGFLGTIDVLFVKHVYGGQLAGLYGAFETLANIAFFVSSSVVAVLLPRASGESRLGRPVAKRILLLTYALVIALNAGAVIICKLFPHMLVLVLFGAKYAAYSQSLWLFALASGMQALLLLEANIAYARHDYVISISMLVVNCGMVLAVYAGRGSLTLIPAGVAVAVFAGWLIAFVRHFSIRKKYFLEQSIRI